MAGGEVADHRVEPDVDALRVLGVALDRNRNAPVDVAGHRTRLHLAREVEREVADVRPPVRLRLDPLDEPLAERGQVEEQVRRLAELGRRAVHDRARVDQVDRIELVAAVVALVASRLAVAADRARPLDVAVGERPAGRRGDRPERRLLDEEPLLVQRAEHVLDDGVVVARRRPREAVIRHAETDVVVEDQRVVAVGELTRGHAFAVGGDHHRRAVLVRPADHEDVVALEPVIAREDVRRHAGAGDVAEMPRAARVGPRDRDEDLLRRFRHRRQLLPRLGEGPRSYDRLSAAYAARDTRGCAPPAAAVENLRTRGWACARASPSPARGEHQGKREHSAPLRCTRARAAGSTACRGAREGHGWPKLVAGVETDRPGRRRLDDRPPRGAPSRDSARERELLPRTGRPLRRPARPELSSAAPARAPVRGSRRGPCSRTRSARGRHPRLPRRRRRRFARGRGRRRRPPAATRSSRSPSHCSPWPAAGDRADRRSRSDRPSRESRGGRTARPPRACRSGRPCRSRPARPPPRP